MRKYKIGFWEDDKYYPEHEPVAAYFITESNEDSAIAEATKLFNIEHPELDLSKHTISSEDAE